MDGKFSLPIRSTIKIASAFNQTDKEPQSAKMVSNIP